MVMLITCNSHGIKIRLDTNFCNEIDATKFIEKINSGLSAIDFSDIKIVERMENKVGKYSIFSGMLHRSQ